MPKTLKDYQITEQTLCLIPIKNKHLTRYDTLVLEIHQCYLVKRGPMGIIIRSCIRNGFNFKSLQKVVSKLFRKKRKLPYFISDAPLIVMFPTCRSRWVSNCCYISATQISELLTDKEQTIIKFLNGKSVKIKTSLHHVKAMREKSYAVIGYHMMYKLHEK